MEYLPDVRATEEAGSENIQPIVEIVTEFAIGDHFQIAVSRGDQPHVGLDQFIAAETFKLLLLKDAQQLRL